MRIAIKVGSNVLTRKDGTLDAEQLASLAGQLAALRRQGVEVVLVSSGAVAAGRTALTPQKKLDPVRARQLFSAVGQVRLINRYSELLAGYGLLCGQVLATKENFRSRRHYLTMQECIATMLANGVIPIVNENDTVSVTELMFTDNDELAGLISEMMSVEALIILSNVDGIFTGLPGAPGAALLRDVAAGQSLGQHIAAQKSEFGRGGMLTKASIAGKVAAAGIAVYIANGRRPGILTGLALGGGEAQPPCTRFAPSPKATSSVKRWVANSEAFAKGAIVVNSGAREVLLQKAASLLPVGVVRIEGDFEKDDVVKICDEQGATLGVGRVTRSSSRARQVAGRQGEKALVHYDYLFLL
ncbi:MAG: glutamate 5-kinase [Prevotellaceae bacterium]|jgi:glutamate 5-kinase|nr:glutamate 5-kinase [Prevotellaceae bacterium]